MKTSAHFYQVDGRLWFHLDRGSTVQNAQPFEFDGPADGRHMKDYALALSKFLREENAELELIKVSSGPQPDQFDVTGAKVKAKAVPEPLPPVELPAEPVVEPEAIPEVPAVITSVAEE